MSQILFQFLLVLILGGAVTGRVSAENLHPSSVEWISFRNVSLLDSLVEPAGWVESTQKPYYIARTRFRWAWFPGYVHKGDHDIWIGHDGRQYFTDYEFLVYPRGALSWVHYSNYSLPRNAFSGGNDPDTKEPIFMCRTKQIDTSWYGKQLLLPGKMKRRLGRCAVQLHGVVEHFYDEFEVLVDNRAGAESNGSPPVYNCTPQEVHGEWLDPAVASRDQVLLAGEIMGYPVFLARTHNHILGYVINEENTVRLEINKRPMNRSYYFELLGCGEQLEWKHVSESDANLWVYFEVQDAEIGGPLHICRARYGGEHTIPGRVPPNKNPPSCVFRFGEKVFESEDDFEILVNRSSSGLYGSSGQESQAVDPPAQRNWEQLLIITIVVVLLVLLGGIPFIIYKWKPFCWHQTPRPASSSWATNELLSDESAHHPL